MSTGKPSGRPRGFPEGQCTKCGDTTAYINHVGTHYCAKHRRFTQMRMAAKAGCKQVPTEGVLQSLIPADMRCQVCKRIMNWFAYGGKATQMTLQHDCDGTLRLICFGCNSRHARLPGDLLYQLKPGEKYCHGCKAIKQLTDFYRTNPKSVRTGRGSRCKVCANAAHRDWAGRNRERVSEYQRRSKASKQGVTR